MDREFPREDYYSKLSWLLLGRLLLAVFLVGSLLFFQFRYEIYHIPLATLVEFTTVVGVLSGLYGRLLKTSQNLVFLAYVQISGDILLISWLVLFTGGIDSGFSIIYHLAIIAASIILYRRGGYYSASLASILYGGILDLQYYGALGLPQSQNYTSVQVLFLLFVNILSFYLVAFLSGLLSERLRKTRQALREKSSDLNDLKVLQYHILRSVGSGIATIDMSGEITSWNNSAEQITGYSYEDVRGRAKDVFGQGIKGLFGHTDDLRDHSVRFQGEIVKRAGTKATLGFTASLLKDDNDLVRGIILTFQDITRLIEMEEQIRQQERLATVGSLAAGIAHEIRNPLASLSGSIQMLQSDLDLKGEHKHLMDIVLRETDRLNTIITEFLDYARPRSIQQEPIALESLLRETIELFRNSRNYHNDMFIEQDVLPDLIVSGDPHRLRQVIWNLLINAGQAVQGKGTIRVSAGSHRTDDSNEIAIRIADTGSGIAREHMPNIFDPFFTTKSDGTGLGLAIAYRIITDHAGSIDVHSVVGEGTVFTIKLPSRLEQPTLDRSDREPDAVRQSLRERYE